MDENGADDESEAAENAPWSATFHFIGERSVKFKVFEEVKGGMTLDSTDVIEGLTRAQQIFKKSCTVRIPNARHLDESTLQIDGQYFRDLKDPRKKSDEAIAIAPDVLTMQYGIDVPHKYRSDPPPGLAAIQAKWLEGVDNVQ